MSELLIIEVADMDEAMYKRTNEILGVDTYTGEGHWPNGLVSHAAGPMEGGGWSVVEVWENRSDQDAFMNERLGPALASAGMQGPPSRLEWRPVVAHQTPGN